MSANEPITSFGFPATVTRASNAAPALVDLAKQRAPDATIFDTFPPYFFRARISTDRLDTFSTRMRPSSLQNYAADAETGVAFQDSHKTDGLVRTLGHSLTGKYAGPQGNGVAHTDADFYTVQGMDPTIDSFINKQRAGITRDVSIGFYGGQFICSICGRDMLTDYDCWHFPGMSYTPRDEEGRKIKDAAPVVCTADVENARLSEVSTVYDGATPGAVILKAQQAAEDGRMQPETARLLESRYRILDLSKVQHIHPAATPEPQEHRMTEPQERAAEAQPVPQIQPDMLSQIRDVLRQHGWNGTDPEVMAEVRRIIDENTRLRPLADDGTAYRDDLVEQALAEGVRAFGPTFARETYEGVLKSVPLSTIKRMRDDWAAVGNAQFAGGRVTVDEDERQQPGEFTLKDPDQTPTAAFAG